VRQFGIQYEKTASNTCQEKIKSLGLLKASGAKVVILQDNNSSLNLILQNNLIPREKLDNCCKMSYKSLLPLPFPVIPWEGLQSHGDDSTRQN